MDAASDRAAPSVARRHEFAVAHLDLYRTVIVRALRQLAIEREAHQRDEPSDTERLLQRVERTLAREGPAAAPAQWDPAAIDAEQRLRAAAAEEDCSLPLDELRTWCELDESDLLCLAAAAAGEHDDEFAAVIAMSTEGISAGRPTIGLLTRLIAGVGDGAAARISLGQLGALRSSGLVEVVNPADVPPHQQIALGDGVLEYLLGFPVDLGALVEVDERRPIGDCAVGHLGDWPLADLCDAVAECRLDVIGLWHQSSAVVTDAATLVAEGVGADVRRVALRADRSPLETLRRELLLAPAGGNLVLLTIDASSDEDTQRVVAAIEPLLCRSRQTLLLGGTTPWRPSSLLGARRYLEIHLSTPTWSERTAMWTQQFAGTVDAGAADQLASRFQLSTTEISTAATLARVEIAVGASGERAATALTRACSTVVRCNGDARARTPRPSATLDRLVLSDDLKSQIAEIGSASGHLGFVGEEWGFERHGGPTGYKALFLGEPGTGKTMAAEVIAGMISVPLMVVDLANTVSKWVGETSKNLDGIFNEAERTNAVLFFDEADALFGKRAEVRHGTDRYANSEVSHLLVRFERHRGLVILASNLRENIDNAFVRRFHSLLHFPRPDRDARAQLWAQAFPPEAPLADALDLEALSELDMTGAAIVNSARRAALLAAGSRRPITMLDIVEAVRRQFQSEARVLRPDDLPGYLPGAAAVLDHRTVGVG